MAAIATNTENESRAVVVLNRTVRENWVWEPAVAAIDDGLRKELEAAFESFIKQIEAFKQSVKKEEVVV